VKLYLTTPPPPSPARTQDDEQLVILQQRLQPRRSPARRPRRRLYPQRGGRQAVRDAVRHVLSLLRRRVPDHSMAGSHGQRGLRVGHSCGHVPRVCAGALPGWTGVLFHWKRVHVGGELDAHAAGAMQSEAEAVLS
jgi:hypothetical protein